MSFGSINFGFMNTIAKRLHVRTQLLAGEASFIEIQVHDKLKEQQTFALKSPNRSKATSQYMERAKRTVSRYPIKFSLHKTLYDDDKG